MTARELFDLIFAGLGITSEQCSLLGKLYELAEHYGVAHRNKTEAQIMRDICNAAVMLHPEDYLWMPFLQQLSDFVVNYGTVVFGDSPAYVQPVPPAAYPLAKVYEIGGKSVVWNQTAWFITDKPPVTAYGVTISVKDHNTLVLNGECTTSDWTYSVSNQFMATLPYRDKNIYPVGGGNGISFAWIKGAGLRTVFTAGITYTNYEVTLALVDTDVCTAPTEWIEQYAAAHPEYNAGEIISADVESVTVQSANLLTDENARDGYFRSDGEFAMSGLNHTTDYIPVTPLTRYTLAYSPTVSSSAPSIVQYDVFENPIKFTNNLRYGASFTTEANTAYVRVPFHVDEIGRYSCLKRGNDAPFSPYYKIIRTIPEAIRQLDGYGWSAGTARNYIEQTDDGRWVYHKQVGATKMSDITLRYSAYTDRQVFTCSVPGMSYEGNLTNIIFSWANYNLRYASPASMPDKSYRGGNGSNTLYFRDDDCAGISDFYAKNPNATVAYELENHEDIDITDLMGSALAEFEVEAGGSVTFDNAAMLEVPNKVKYHVNVDGLVDLVNGEYARLLAELE